MCSCDTLFFSSYQDVYGVTLLVSPEVIMAHLDYFTLYHFLTDFNTCVSFCLYVCDFLLVCLPVRLLDIFLYFSLFLLLPSEDIYINSLLKESWEHLLLSFNLANYIEKIGKTIRHQS